MYDILFYSFFIQILAFPDVYMNTALVMSYIQIQCYFCGEDSQGSEGAEASEGH